MARERESRWQEGKRRRRRSSSPSPSTTTRLQNRSSRSNISYDTCAAPPLLSALPFYACSSPMSSTLSSPTSVDSPSPEISKEAAYVPPSPSPHSLLYYADHLLPSHSVDDVSEEHGSSLIIGASTVIGFLVLIITGLTLTLKITRFLAHRRESRRRKEVLSRPGLVGGAGGRRRGKGVKRNAFDQPEWEGVPVSFLTLGRGAFVLTLSSPWRWGAGLNTRRPPSALATYDPTPVHSLTLHTSGPDLNPLFWPFGAVR